MFLNGWKIRKIEFSDAWKLYKIHILVSPGRVLLEHSYACLCVVCICFYVTARVVVTEQLTCKASVWFSSVAPSCLTLWPHGRQHVCLPYPFIILLGLKSISVGLSYDDHLTWDLWTSSEFRYSMQESLEPNVIKQKIIQGMNEKYLPHRHSQVCQIYFWI